MFLVHLYYGIDHSFVAATNLLAVVKFQTYLRSESSVLSLEGFSRTPLSRLFLFI